MIARVLMTGQSIVQILFVPTGLGKLRGLRLHLCKLSFKDIKLFVGWMKQMMSLCHNLINKTMYKGALCRHGGGKQTQKVNQNNINKVIIQTQTYWFDVIPCKQAPPAPLKRKKVVKINKWRFCHCALLAQNENNRWLWRYLNAAPHHGALNRGDFADLHVTGRWLWHNIHLDTKPLKEHYVVFNQKRKTE